MQHGESQFNVEGKIGGDSMLSPRGILYMKALPALVTDNIGDAPLTASQDPKPTAQLLTNSLQVWTSTLQRTIQTASELLYNKLTWKSLDELDAGVCDGMTYEEIEVCGLYLFSTLLIGFLLPLGSISRGLRQSR
jgi:6-phosphofructo-2-kinase/fructose-2,6-biphosphatase 2